MKPWPTVRLDEELRRSEETITLQADAEYRQITVKLWGKRVVLRGILTEAEIAVLRQMVARRGQFILPRVAEVARRKFAHRPRNEPRFYSCKPLPKETGQRAES